jgi:hypothetical protein
MLTTGGPEPRRPNTWRPPGRPLRPPGVARHRSGLKPNSVEADFKALSGRGMQADIDGQLLCWATTA